MIGKEGMRDRGKGRWKWKGLEGRTGRWVNVEKKEGILGRRGRGRGDGRIEEGGDK